MQMNSSSSSLASPFRTASSLPKVTQTSNRDPGELVTINKNVKLTNNSNSKNPN